MSEDVYRIIGLEAENLKRLKAVDITFGDGLIVIGGENENGKSSTLDAIAMALGGKALVPDEPVRRGHKSARTTVTLSAGDLKYTVTRRFTAKGTTSLTIEAADGEEQRSPQTFLDSILGSLSFDPLAFAKKMDRKEQAEVLRQLVGLDTSAVEAETKELFDARTEAGREKARLAAALAGLTHHKDVPEEEVSLTALTDELEAAKDAAAKRWRIEQNIEHSKARRKFIASEIAKLQAEDKELKENIATMSSEHQAMAVPDAEAIRHQLQTAEETNRKVRENRSRAAVGADLEAAEKRHRKLNAAVEEKRAEKEKMLASCKFPVEGLSVDENGVRFKGLPFDQAGGAEQLRVSVAMGFAMNPKLKLLLIKDGSLLDDKSMGLVAQMATEAGAQVIMERVGKDKHTTILIEDGEVAE